MNDLVNKTILKKILFFLIVSGVFFSPFSSLSDPGKLVSVAHAATTQEQCVADGGTVEESGGVLWCVKAGGLIRTRITEDGNNISIGEATKEVIGGATKAAAQYAIGPILRVIGITLLKISSIILWMAGTLFNASVNFSIIHISSFVNGSGVINEAWTVIRDVINMAFIFILLYIAILTILGLGKDTKKTIVQVIIAALLINFSLFFTKVIIDGANIIALQFYSAIAPEHVSEQKSQSSWWESVRSADGGISNIFADAVKITAAYNPSTGQTEEGLEKLIGPLDEGENFLTVTFLGSVFLLILAFVFFTGAFLFIIRFAILILLMIASPFAFVGLMLPQFRQWGNKWWKELLNQAFFAPAFMILMYIVALVVTSDSFIKMSEGANLSDAFLGQGSIVIILNFFIVSVLAVAAIIISKSMMSGASRGAVNWATKTGGKLSFGTAGFAGRQSVGRLAQGVSQSAKFQAMTRRMPLGRHLYSGVQKVSKSSFDARSTGPGQAFSSTLGAGQTGRKGGFTEYKDEKKKKIRQYDKDTQDGADHIRDQREKKIEAARKAYELQKETAAKKTEKYVEAAGLKERAADKIEDTEKEYDEAPAATEEKKVAREKMLMARKELEMAQKEFEFRKSEAEMARRELLSKKASLEKEENSSEDPYLDRLEKGSDLPKNIPIVGKALDKVYQGFRKGGLLQTADQEAATEIRKWRRMDTTERALEQIKEELKKASERAGDSRRDSDRDREDKKEDKEE